MTVLHATGLVSRSDGNDTHCGVSSRTPLSTTDDEAEVTCKLCLRVLASMAEDLRTEESLKSKRMKRQKGLT